MRSFLSIPIFITFVLIAKTAEYPPVPINSVEDMLADSFFEISSNNKNINDLYLSKLIFFII